MSVFHIAKALVIFGAVSSIPPAIAGDPTEYPTASPSPTSVAGYILQGLASTSTSSVSSQKPSVTVSVPQANIVWQDKFPSASISHARSCWKAYTEWFASYPGYYASANISLSSTALSTLSTFVHPASSTIWPTGNVSTYKLCDGTPRASYSPSTTHFDSSTITEMEAYSTAYPTPIPEQACTLDQADCAVMYFGSNLNNLSDANSDNDWAQGRLLAACGYPLDVDVPCLVQGGPVEVMYFPVSTTGGDIGGCIEGTTVTPAEEPAPVTTLGTTFHPGTVYVSFETLYAAYRSLDGPGGAAVQIGKGYSNHIFQFRSDEISTNCYASVFSTSGVVNPGYGPGTQLNFADLNEPPPATAYECQKQCQSVSYELGPGGVNVTTHTIHPNPCETIFDNFNPLIAVPTKLRARHPEWASCRFWNHRQANIVFDPPIALTQAMAVAKPTLPGGYTTTSAAMPASTAGRPATQTATAAADNMPSVISAQPSAPSNPSPYDPGAQDSTSASSAAMQPTVIVFTPIAVTPTTGTDVDSAGSASSSSKQIFAAGDITITAVSIPGATDAVEVHGSTVSVGGPVATVDGAVVSMGTSGLVAVYGPATAPSQLVAFTPISGAGGSSTETAVTSAQQVLVAGDVTITAVSISGVTDAVEVDGKTVSVGGSPVTIDGEIVSMGTNGLVAIQTSTMNPSRSTTRSGSHTYSSSSSAAPTTSGSSGSANRPLLVGYGLVFVVSMFLVLP